MTPIQIVDIIFTQESRILLVQQKKPSAYGMWGLPGGHVEAGESPRQAIIREVKEELHMALSDKLLLDTFTHIEQLPSGDSLKVSTFLAIWPDGSPIIQEEELIGFGWFTINQMIDIASHLRSPWVLPLAKQSMSAAGKHATPLTTQPDQQEPF